MSQGLEDLKWLIENGYIKLHSWQEDVIMLDCVNNIEKELKALEIIRVKKVNVRRAVMLRENYDDYLENYGRLFTHCEPLLTEDEFNLLKEVLS